MRRKSRWVAAVIVATLAVASAVSISGGAATAAPKVQGINGTVIKVGGISQGGAVFGAAGIDLGFKARIDRANSKKELGKYTIDYIGSTEDGGAVDKALPIAQSLVERDQVFAVAPAITLGMQQSVGTYLAGKKVPYYGIGFTPAFCVPNTYGISPAGCAAQAKYGYNTTILNADKAVGKDPKDVKWAFVALGTPDGQHTLDGWSAFVKSTGGQLVYAKAPVPLGGASDYSPIVNEVLATHPDIVWTLTGNEAFGVTAAFKNGGFTGVQGNSALYFPGLAAKFGAAASLVDGMIVQASTPVLEANYPFAKQMLADYQALGKTTDDITFGGMYAYMSADLLVATLKKVAPNFQNVVQMVSKGYKYNPDKDSFPQEWPAVYNSTGKCGAMVQLKGSTFTEVAPYNCNGQKVNTDTGKVVKTKSG